MFDQFYFSYDGKYSKDYGLMIGTVDTSNDTPFGVNTEIVEEQINRINKPFFYGVNNKPLTFNVTMFTTNEWKTEYRSEIVRWLFQNEYKPLISDDNTGIVYYCMPISESKLNSFWKQGGFITLQFRCNCPYPFTTERYRTIDLSSNTGTTNIEIYGESNISKYTYPQFEFVMKGSTSLDLKNMNDSGREFTISGLNIDETVNAKYGEVISNVNGVYRMGNCNRKWIRLVYGKNIIQVTGKMLLSYKVQFPISI